MDSRVLEELRAENERLHSELQVEKEQRQGLEQTILQLEYDRARLQRARVELAKNLLAADKRALDAEEALAVAEQNSPSAGNVPDEDPGPSSPRTDRAKVKSLHRDLELLLSELDRERVISTKLESKLETVRAEATTAATELVGARKRIKELEKQLKASLKGKGAPVLPESSSSASLSTVDDASVDQLVEKIAVLKASRDKLIAALDSQSADAERLAMENIALAESLSVLKKTALALEAQAQDGITRGEALKDLLEESATWDLPATNKPDSPPTPSLKPRQDVPIQPGGGGSPPLTPTTKDLTAQCQRLQAELLAQKAKGAELEVQVRALCLELTRMGAVSAQVQQGVMPVLGGIEGRLAQVLGLKPVSM